MPRLLLIGLLSLLGISGLFSGNGLGITQAQAAPVAETDPLNSSGLAHLMMQALQEHPQLQMAEQAYLAAKARIKAASALPDPLLTAGIRNVGINKFTIGTEPMSGAGASLQQNFPNPAKLSLMEQIAYRQSLQLEQAWHLQRRQIRRQIQISYFALIENQKAQAINAEIQALFKALQATAEAYYKLGKIPQKEIWRIKTERSRLDLQLQELKQQYLLKQNQLRQDLGWREPQIADLALTGLKFSHPPLPALATLETHLKTHPLWLQQNQGVLETELQVELAKSQLSPDYMLMGGLTQRGLLDPVWELRGGMTLPIYAKDKQEPEIEAARLKHVAQQFKLDQTQQILLQELNQAWIQIQESRRQQALYTQQLIPERRLVFEAALALFPVGQSDLLELIQEISKLLRDQRENLALALQEYKALSDLQYLTGVNG